ncbi:relaxase domain-containing protein [Streptomyces sp. NPDC051132]|uniref:relaxase domain-containing protein n=1 Tax=Streptomyces sp. NPDC051132 TaxID=3155667 RepID=UPI0034287DE0
MLWTWTTAAGTLYLLYFMEEVTARLGWAWEPREVTSGRRPVMEIAGIDRQLIGWQSTRRRQIKDALPVLTARYEERQGHPPGERASYALACQAADQTRPPKRTRLRSLTELRTRWRTSAIRSFAYRRRARRLEGVPGAVAHRPKGRPFSGAGDRRRHGGADPPDARSRPPPSSRTASVSALSPSASGRVPPRRRHSRRVPRSPAPGTHRARPREESRENPERTPQPPGRMRPRPRGPRADGCRARRGTGARVR